MTAGSAGELPPELSAQVDAHVERSGLRGAAARRLREDLEQHFLDGLERGRTPAELLRSFGSLDAFAEAIRATPVAARNPGGHGGLTALLDGLRMDVRVGFRSLAARPILSMVVCLVLALGIGANALALTFVNEIVLAPLPVRDQESLVNVLADVPGGNSFTGFSVGDAADLAAARSVIEGLAATSARRVPYEGSPDERVVVSVVSPGYFQLLGVGAALGRAELPPFTAWGADPVAVVSHAFWSTRLGRDPDVLGSTIRVGSLVLTVVGVASEGFSGTFIGFPTEVWTPLSMIGSFQSDFDPDDRDQKFLELIARRAPGRTIGDVALGLNEVAAAIEDVYPEANRDHRVRVVALTGIDDSLRTGVFTFTAIIGVLAALVLLVACLNTGGVLLVRAMARERELAVRMAVGAGGKRLLGQVMVETGLLATGATILALVLTVQATAGLRTLLAAIPAGVGLELGVDWRVLALTSVVALTATLVAGVAPGLHVLRRRPSSALRDRGDTGGRSARVRDVIVAAQIALSVVLVTSSGLFVRALGAGLQESPGFDADRVAEFREPPADDPVAAVGRSDQLLARIGSLPGVAGVALADRPPVGVSRTPVSVRPPTGEPTADGRLPTSDAIRVSDGYFTVLGVQLLRGRAVVATDVTADDPVAVVTSSFVDRFLPGTDPLGARIDIDGLPHRVVGVAPDLRYVLQDDTPDPLVYLPLPPETSGRTVLYRREAGDAVVDRAVAQVVGEITGSPAPVRARTVRETMSDALLPQRAGALLAGAMGVIALVLAAVGLYGLVQFSVSRNLRALGIRLALGGGRADVLMEVMRRGVVIAGAGVLAGLVIGLPAGGVLEPFLSGVSPRDPLTWLTVLALFALIAIGASLSPALRASRIDPAEILRRD